MDRDICFNIRWDVGVGKKTLRPIGRFWRECVMVCRATGFYGALFKARCGVTQGNPLSPTIFNLMIDTIVREWEQQYLLTTLFDRIGLQTDTTKTESMVFLPGTIRTCLSEKAYTP